MKDIETVIAVNFWFQGECVLNIWTDTYPNYRPDDEIYLNVRVTPIGQEKFKNVASMHGFFIIEKVVHAVDQTVSDDFSTFLKVEVQLKSKLSEDNSAAQE